MGDQAAKTAAHSCNCTMQQTTYMHMHLTQDGALFNQLGLTSLASWVLVCWSPGAERS
jgi:hypothetical protein